MSLNDLAALLKSFIDNIPFTLFDCIILFAFVGYVIEEESYNIGIVIKRTILLVFSSFLALFLYRFPSYFLQDSFFISKGIADGVALLGVWVTCVVLSGLVSHFVVKEKIGAYVMNPKIKIPLTVIVATGGFLSLVWIIVHVFVSLPIPAQAKSLVTSSVIVKRLLVATFQSDVGIQKIYTDDPSNALHVLVVNEEDERKDLRFQTKNIISTDQAEEIVRAINNFRKTAGREALIKEEILSSLAMDMAVKYAQEGEIEDQSSHLASVLGERGTLFSHAKTVTVVSDSSTLVVPSLIAGLSSKTILLDQKIERVGISTVRLNGNSLMVVFIFAD